MQRYSVKLILVKRKKNRLGQCPIYLRTTIDRKSTYISTAHLVVPSMWDEKGQRVKDSYLNAKEINTDISSKKNEILQSLVNASVKGQILSAESIKERTSVKLQNIFAFYEEYMNELKGKRAPETFRNYEYVELLREFHGSSNLSFEQITPTYLTKFEAWLRNGGIKSEDPNNTIALIWSILRAIFNAAKRKLIITCYPFSQYDNPQMVKGKVKEHLTIEELDKFFEYAQSCTRRDRANAWYVLYGCYTGLRFSDWRTFNIKKQVIGDDLVLRATKNKVLVTIPIHSKLRTVLEAIKDLKPNKRSDSMDKAFRRIAKRLEINKHLSTHCCRHTFAVTICLNRGISSETAAFLMAITLKTFVNNYSMVTPYKIRKETEAAWGDL